MAARKVDIELLPQEEWEKTSFGKFLKWTLTVGRWIVITTELVVILAFLSRFKLDRNLSNLYEDIKQKQAIIEASGDFEDDFRFLQKRLAIIKGLSKKQLDADLVIKEISLLTPINVSLSNLSIAGNKVSLTAIALSEDGLAAFLTNLKNSPKFEKLVLSSVSTGIQEGIGIQFELSSEHGY